MDAKRIKITSDGSTSGTRTTIGDDEECISVKRLTLRIGLHDPPEALLTWEVAPDLDIDCEWVPLRDYKRLQARLEAVEEREVTR